MARSHKEHEKILKEARKRFRRVRDFESTARKRFVDDTKFAEGDSDNLWQWPEDIREPRVDDHRPCLTINKTRQHVLDILNDARQSKVSVKIIATGGQATYDSAQAYMGVVRAIEYRSNADTAYQLALRHAVQGGIGYWRVSVVYEDDDSFNLGLRIRRIKDPLLVYLDPDIDELDGSDAKFGFIADDIPKEEFEAAYPDIEASSNSEFGDDSWVRDDVIRVAEYWRRVKVKDRLIGYLNPDSGEMVVDRLSRIPEELKQPILSDPNTKMRDIDAYKVESFLIIGDQIEDEVEWLGQYIPIVRVIGEETVIDGQLDRKGHVRALKDAQRMFNYNASGFVEFGALQTRAPWVGPVEAFEDFESLWETANTENHSYLPYNGLDEQGNQIASPARTEPPRGAPLFLQGMEAAAEWMRMASGQYQADMGAPSNERSGAAINARQRQGDNATFHYLDHQANAIRFTGKIMIDLIPQIYDTERVLKYQAEDGSDQEIHIDPRKSASEGERPLEAVRKEAVEGTEAQRIIFNPNVGRYEVQADVGASFATKRQDAFNAYTQILAQNKELTALIGDLALQYADFPGAEEAARRLKRMVPPQALDESANPEVEGLKQQLGEAQQFIQALSAKLSSLQGDQEVKQEKNAIDAYRAQTDRLAAIKEALGLDASGLLMLVKEVLAESTATSASGAALAGPLHVPDYSEMPEGVPSAMGGPADHQPEPQMAEG